MKKLLVAVVAVVAVSFVSCGNNTAKDAIDSCALCDSVCEEVVEEVVDSAVVDSALEVVDSVAEEGVAE